MDTSPCRALVGTRAVFAGTVTDIQQLQARDPATKVGSQRVIFAVIKGFRNVTTSKVEIISHPFSESCGYEFKKGQRYLVYAWSHEGFLTTGLCSRTRELWRALEDIAYLTGFLRARDAGRVSGRVRLMVPQQIVRVAPSADLKVVLRGAGVLREVRTDSAGNFAFRDVPPVSFSLTLVAPWPYTGEEPVEIEDPDPRQCTTDLTLPMLYDGRISGALLDRSGRPLSGIKVQARGTTGTSEQESRTNVSGRYELTGLSPGSYAVGVNLTGPPSLDAPYPRAFAPGADGSKTAVVQIGAGERKTIAPLVMGAPIPKVPLTACVVGPDQRPTDEATVSVTWHGDSSSSYLMEHPDLDTRGCFSIQALSGLRYQVSAHSTSRRDARGYFLSTVQEIVVGKQTPPVRLVLAPHIDR